MRYSLFLLGAQAERDARLMLGPYLMRRLMVLHAALGAAWLFGALTKDYARATLPFYYVPPAVVAVTGLLLLGLGRRTSAPWLKRAVLALALTAGAKMLVVDFSWRRAAEPGRSIRVVHWNIARGYFGPDPVLEVLRADEADIYLLSEVPDDPRFAGLAERLMPGAFVRQEEGMLLVSRFPFHPVPAPDLEAADCWAVRIGLNPVEVFELLAVDFASEPRLVRHRQIEAIAAWVPRRELRLALLVMGDFNMPRDARAFEPLRRVLVHGYEWRGHGGWPYTWPVGLPAYAIDHAWLNRIQLYRYDLKWSRYSDHARQVLQVRPLPPKRGS